MSHSVQYCSETTTKRIGMRRRVYVVLSVEEVSALELEAEASTRKAAVKSLNISLLSWQRPSDVIISRPVVMATDAAAVAAAGTVGRSVTEYKTFACTVVS